jgi:methionine synthase II (cobalamin-independent)
MTSAAIGSTPEIEHACHLVLQECPELPYLPELPHRGPGADMIGRGALFLSGMHVDLQPAGWRLISSAGRDERRGRDFLERDLDALEVVAGQYVGPLKLQVAGPWTLAGMLELPRGNRSLSDPGAIRDIAESLGDGLAAHVADVQRRVPGARIIVALDEPLLPQVILGRLPTASGFSVLPAPEEGVGEQRLRTVINAAGAPVGIHCCAQTPPINLMRRSGAAFLSLDFTLNPDEDSIAEAVEAGVGIMAGLVSTAEGAILSDVRRTVEPVVSLWRRVGLEAEKMREVAVSPTCGLAGLSPSGTLRAMRACQEAGKLFFEGEL